MVDEAYETEDMTAEVNAHDEGEVVDAGTTSDGASSSARWLNSGEMDPADAAEADPDVCSRCGYEVEPGAEPEPDAPADELDPAAAFARSLDSIFDGLNFSLDAPSQSTPESSIDKLADSLGRIEAKVDTLMNKINNMWPAWAVAAAEIEVRVDNVAASLTTINTRIDSMNEQVGLMAAALGTFLASKNEGNSSRPAVEALD
jgi:outer membrane murein-binding lipoprotein Lpp